MSYCARCLKHKHLARFFEACYDFAENKIFPHRLSSRSRGILIDGHRPKRASFRAKTVAGLIVEVARDVWPLTRTNGESAITNR